jgi:cephalosporin-C deacetylase-like acetyl esterase
MYKQEFPDIPIGYSGHEMGTAISVAAVALGAQVRQETCSRMDCLSANNFVMQVHPSKANQGMLTF